MRITDDNAEMGARDSHLAGHVEFNGQAESCCQSRCGHITLGALWKIREDHLDEVQAPDRACSLKGPIAKCHRKCRHGCTAQMKKTFLVTMFVGMW